MLLEGEVCVQIEPEMGLRVALGHLLILGFAGSKHCEPEAAAWNEARAITTAL